MKKTTKINQSITLVFSSRDENSGDTIMECNISFDNPRDDSIIVQRLNTWLAAIGRANIVVEIKSEGGSQIKG